MAKVFGLHMLRLRPGVDAEEFEVFVKNEVVDMPIFEGWKAYVLKGLRGDREGRYLRVFEVESVEALNRYAPGVGPEGFTAAAQQFMEDHALEWQPIQDKWDTFATSTGIIFTDYVVVE